MKSKSKIFFLFVSVSCVFLLSACVGEKNVKQEVHYAEEGSIPYRIAILPPEYIQPESNSTTVKSIIMDDDKIFVANIARGALRNQLAGKGYQPVQLKVVDNTLAGLGRDEGWRKKSDKELCKLLEADGVVHISIFSADMVKAVAFDLFKIDAEVKIINAEGENVGSWRESASKRRVSVPTGILSLAGTLVEQVFSDPVSRQMRMVVYEWAWNLSQSLPDCPTGAKLPEVISVDTNVDNRIFGIGQKIAVRVDAQNELTCSFSIGDFKKNIPLPQTSPGVYEGFYAVKEGDKAANEPLVIRMRKSNGVERLWIESGSLLTVDGTPPDEPQNLQCIAGRDGISLSWKNPGGEGLKEFVVERGNDPVGKFEVIGRTQELKFNDPQSPQGQTVYYRVRSVDSAGNLSKEKKPVAVTVPQFDIRELSGSLSGKLVRGNYIVSDAVRVDPGRKFEIGSGTVLTFKSGGSLHVGGELNISGDIESPAIFNSNGTVGIISSRGGRIKIRNAVFNGFDKAVVGDGGYVGISSSEFQTNGKTAVLLNGGGAYDLQGVRISGSETGVIISSGQGQIVRSFVSNCTIGVQYSGGEATIAENNIYGNRVNLKADTKLVLEDNYWGSSSADSLKVVGDVLVRSIYDAPYPHGRKIVLVDETVMTPEVKEKRFSEAKVSGEKAFHEQRYGDSYKAFNEALKYGEDRDVFLYLAYTLLALEENEQLEHTLNEGISKFSYDVRLQQIYVRYLMGQGRIGEARAVLDKALKLSPADQKLIFMKEYLNSAAESSEKNESEHKVGNSTTESAPAANSGAEKDKVKDEKSAPAENSQPEKDGAENVSPEPATISDQNAKSWQDNKAGPAEFSVQDVQSGEVFHSSPEESAPVDVQKEQPVKTDSINQSLETESGVPDEQKTIK
jgi:fibronectin type 3 domain-containing protein